VLSVLVATCASVEARPVQGAAQPPAGDQEQKQVETRISQRRVADSGEKGVVLVDSSGAVDPAFKNFDVPFSLWRWYDRPDKSACDTVTFRNTDQKNPVTVSFVSSALRQMPASACKPPAGKTVFNALGITLSAASQATATSPSEAIVFLDQLRALKVGARIDLVVASTVKPVAGISLTFQKVRRLPTYPTQPREGKETVLVLLDRTGVANPRFLNPRRPYFIGPENAAATPEQIKTFQRNAVLRFESRLPDRTLRVVISSIKQASRWEFLAKGIRIRDCDGKTCSAQFLVAPLSWVTVPVSLLREAFVTEGADQQGTGPLVEFTVSLFDEEGELSNATGVVSLVQFDYLEPPAGGSKWTSSASATGGWAPDLSHLVTEKDGDPVISPATPQGDEIEGTVAAKASVSLTQKLGNKANAEFELRVKNGPFGQETKVEATKYRVNVLGNSGLKFSAGRYDVAAPSYSIAAEESGEAVGASWGSSTAAYIFRKEVPDGLRDSLDPKATHIDRDHAAGLLHLRDLPGLAWKYARVQGFGLMGRDGQSRVPAAPTPLPDTPAPSSESDEAPPPGFERYTRRYGTLGAELLFNVPRTRVQGSLSHYRSYRASNASAAVAQAGDAGRGAVTLLTGAWTNFDTTIAEETRGVDYTVTGFFGAGSGDRPGTGDNEGYIGETAAFSPDSLFIATLAPEMQLASGIAVGDGLSNKTYLGANLVFPRWSPLKYTARGLRATEDEITGASTTIKAHAYWLRAATAPDSPRYLGFEVDVDFTVASPPGINYTLSLASFWPGDALTSIVTRTQWSVTGTVAVKLP
jgi:hypothetical protein